MANRERADQTVRDGLSSTGQHPFNESSSPPSPTTPGVDAPERVWQVFTLRFGSDTRPGHGEGPPSSKADAPRHPPDLTWHPPPLPTRHGAWQHDVRRLVGGYRVCVPQLEAIVGVDTPAVAGFASEDHWELRARRRSDRVTLAVNVDGRMGAVIPRGVRHRLALVDDVVVSVNPTLGVVRIWSTGRLDGLMGADA